MDSVFFVVLELLLEEAELELELLLEEELVVAVLVVEVDYVAV